MKNLLRKVTYSILCSIILLGLGSQVIFAEENNKENLSGSYKRENTDISKIYQQAVEEGVFTSANYPYTSWLKLEKSFLWPNYVQVKEDHLIKQTQTYEKWLRDNHYGVATDFDDNNFEKMAQGRSTADNKQKFVNMIQKGDFIVVSDVREPWAPFIGHTAIATTDNWVLDMPGYKDGSYSKSDNNRQLKKGDWFNKYQKAWMIVYRVRTSKSIRNDIADWADWRYWATNHGTKKNRHVAYSLATLLKGDYSRAYCSKLVWQALYYGSGNVSLVKPRPATFAIFPYFLPGEINLGYTPTKYGPF